MVRKNGGLLLALVRQSDVDSSPVCRSGLAFQKTVFYHALDHPAESGLLDHHDLRQFVERMPLSPASVTDQA